MPHPVLILGATGGVGEALARRLASQGRPLFLAGRDPAALQDLADELGAAWGIADILDPASLAATVKAAAPFGGLSGLAYCVGSIDIKPLDRSRPEDFLQAFQINALGAALSVQAARAALISGKGAVVLFSTVAVGQGFPNHSITAAAKGAVEGLVRSLAAELAPDVRVNGVAPSLTRTRMAAALLGNEAVASGIARLHPIPRLGDADDTAAAAAFLMGPEAGWITGQILGVDGGRSALRVKG